MRRFPVSVWLFTLALAAFTSLPYVVGGLSAPQGWQYSGAAAIPNGAQVDYNSHLAKMWQGRRGQWDYHLLFSHEAHPGLPLVQGFYVALGALANLTPFSLPAVYHLARFGLTVGLVLAIWAFAAHYFEKPRERWLATLFGTIVAGWSWLLLTFDPAMTAEIAPIEFWLSDAFNLLGALVMPHFAAAVIVQIIIVLTFEAWVRGSALTPDPFPSSLGGEAARDRGEMSGFVGDVVYEHKPSSGKKVRTRYIVSVPAKQLIVLTLALAAQAIIQPYAVLLFGPLLVLLAAYHVFSSHLLTFRRALCLVIPLGIYAGLVGYQYVALNSDPIWASFTAQNITLSPPVTYYLLGYLPFIIPMALGLRAFLLDKADDRWLVLIIWTALVAALLYAPFPTQRRYLLGVQTPLAVMAAYGWSRAVLPRLRARWRPLATLIYLGVASVAVIGLVVVNIAALSQPGTHTAVFYQPDELQAFAWMKRETTGRNDLVLTVADVSGQGSGGRLVAAVGQRVYLGHWIETADFAGKVARVQQFYDPTTSDEWRQQFLRDSGAVYVWYDGYARQIGAWNPSEAEYLEAVLATETVTIFRVRAEALP